jgi:hypothetical protein
MPRLGMGVGHKSTNKRTHASIKQARLGYWQRLHACVPDMTPESVCWKASTFKQASVDGSPGGREFAVGSSLCGVYGKAMLKHEMRSKQSFVSRRANRVIIASRP